MCPMWGTEGGRWEWRILGQVRVALVKHPLAKAALEELQACLGVILAEGAPDVPKS